MYKTASKRQQGIAKSLGYSRFSCSTKDNTPVKYGSKVVKKVNGVLIQLTS